MMSTMYKAKLTHNFSGTQDISLEQIHVLTLLYNDTGTKQPDATLMLIKQRFLNSGATQTCWSLD